MANLSSKLVRDINSLYEGIYSEVLTEEKQNELLMIEWYNSLVEEGYIDGNKIEEKYEQETLNEVWSKVAGAVTKYGPKVMQGLRNVTGFGLGPTAGGKRKILTTGAGTATALDPQRASEIVGGTISGTARAVKGGVEGAYRGVTQQPQQQQPTGTAYIDPQTGTIKYR
jgi:hypothetical protein